LRLASKKSWQFASRSSETGWRLRLGTPSGNSAEALQSSGYTFDQTGAGRPLVTVVSCSAATREVVKTRLSTLRHYRLMRRVAPMAAIGLMTMACVSCDGFSQATKVGLPAAPAVPADAQRAAEAALGSETEVVANGDLAKDGHPQALAINHLKVAPDGAMPGTLLTPVAIIENDRGAWEEIFHCDAHLKNTNGYLIRTPLAPVNGWQLKYEQDPGKGLQMNFTPLAAAMSGCVVTIGVRWNPSVRRYQPLDESSGRFLDEQSALETPESQVRI